MKALVNVNDLRDILIFAGLNMANMNQENVDSYFRLAAKTVKLVDAKLSVKVVWDDKIAGIKAARAMFDLGLKQAKDIIEGDCIVGKVSSSDKNKIETYKRIANQHNVKVEFI